MTFPASWVQPATRPRSRRIAGWGGGRVFNFSLDRARDQAWSAATRLHRLDATARAIDAAEIDRLVSVIALLITRPNAPVSWLLPIARWFEDDDPREVTRRLLGPLR